MKQCDVFGKIHLLQHKYEEHYHSKDCLMNIKLTNESDNCKPIELHNFD